MENLYTARIIRPSAFSHLTDNAFCLHAPPPPPPPPHPKKLHNLGFSFLLGITIASKEIEDDACAGFFFEGGRAKRCILGDVQMANGQKTKYGF